ncbi:hypothetical protein F8388_013346 [Cannabis sativa]|uniref:Uncharacterized protein n=1 Tax=Cannabis sativa TaxID=3483 RepID=A0A7J6FEI5_CANSA|nr:hypothetical protein F8388_013346 [Cannabis sativa]
MWESNGVILNENVLAITGSMTLVLMVDQRPIFDSKIPCFLQSLLNAHWGQSSRSWGVVLYCPFQSLPLNMELAISVAVCKLGARINGIPLYKHIAKLAGHNKMKMPGLAFPLVKCASTPQKYQACDLMVVSPRGHAVFKSIFRYSSTNFFFLQHLTMVSVLCSLLSVIQTQMPWICFSTGILVGLSRAPRLAQGQSIKIQLLAAFPVQIDGEPWFRQSCTLAISHHGQAFMLKSAAEEPLGHAATIITDVLENAETNSVINASQKRALLQEMALRLS